MEQRLDRLRQEEIAAPPFRRIDGDWRTGLLILCDHAENAIPRRLWHARPHAEDLHRHIAYDLGAAEVTEHLAGRSARRRCCPASRGS